MAKTKQTVHTRIANVNALCGRKPGSESSPVVVFTEFFGHEKDDLCARCLEIARRRGYRYDVEHEKYLARHPATMPVPPTATTGGHDARI